MASSTSTLIRNASVFDSVAAMLRPNMSVMLRGDRIEWVAPAAERADAAADTVIDGTGLTVLPGLVNSHVHLSMTGKEHSGPPAHFSMTDGVLNALRSLEVSLRCGVTAVRDCGAPEGLAIDIARAVDEGRLAGPRIQAAGRPITITGGHAHLYGAVANGPDAVTAAVRTEIASGAGVIKLMATGGSLTPGKTGTRDTAFTTEELRAAVAASHNAGRRITAHAIGGDGILQAISAGIDSIEHGKHFTDETIAMAVDRGTVFVPTLVGARRIVDLADSLPTFMVDRVRQDMDAARRSFGMALEAGVLIAAGTDSGIPGTGHDDLVPELEIMVEFGMSPTHALQSATLNGAVNLGWPEIGVVGAGYLADLLIVEGDPTRDISVLRNITHVIKNGETVHGREESPHAGR